MKTLLKNRLTKPTIYDHFLVRALLALFAAHLVVSYGQKENLFELLVLPYYYPALGASFAMALVILETIYRANRYLNKKHPWEAEPIIRTAKQILAGILLPLVLSVAMASFYFWCYGINISDTIYFQYYFMIITFMIILVNLVYLIIYGIRAYLSAKKMEAFNKSAEVPDESAETENREDDNEIALIYFADKSLFAKTREGKMLIWTNPIKYAIDDLPGDLYFQINRNCIVRRDIIKNVVQTGTRKMEVELTAPFVKKWKVSSRRSRDFGTWYRNP